jgi:D-methionine transport system permease protein
MTSFIPDLFKALSETAIMLAVGLSVSVVLGGLLGLLLYIWQEERLAKRPIYRLIFGSFVNVVRSFPFVVLMIAVTPLSRTLTGTTIGPVAAAVPLSIAGIAYFARLVELSLLEVPKGSIEAAQAMGASLPKIVFSVLLPEARASLILAVTTLAISYLSYSAAAGVIGGGGVGDLAIRYGYYRFQTKIMFVTVIGLVLLVQLIQTTGYFLARRADKR